MAGSGTGGEECKDDRGDEAVRRRILGAADPSAPIGDDRTIRVTPPEGDRTYELRESTADEPEEALPPLYRRGSLTKGSPPVDDDELPPLYRPGGGMLRRLEAEDSSDDRLAELPRNAAAVPSPPMPATTPSWRPSNVRSTRNSAQLLHAMRSAATSAGTLLGRLSLRTRAGRAVRRLAAGPHLVAGRLRRPASDVPPVPAHLSPPTPARRRPSRLLFLAGAAAGVVVVGVIVSRAVSPTSLPAPAEAASSAQVAASAIGESEEGAAVLGVLADGVSGAGGVLQQLATSVGEAVAGLTSPGSSTRPMPSAAQAYRNQFGHSLDEDLEEHGPEVEAWLINWRAAYERGEPWAVQLAR